MRFHSPAVRGASVSGVARSGAARHDKTRELCPDGKGTPVCIRCGMSTQDVILRITAALGKATNT